MENQNLNKPGVWRPPPTPRPVQREQVREYIKRVNNLFDDIHSTMKNDVTPHNATKMEKDTLHFQLEQCKESVLSKIVKSVRAYEDYRYTEPIIIPKQKTSKPR
ncbi:unnamed protein product [Euphydryas editha]|uniref:Uncharacterized protein n=1 Tax=Euphydryas editha TaxID=104508 RepID=A0AAU9UUV4_EUPED|nr:unnamed protein product [Euphydryas editha]